MDEEKITLKILSPNEKTERNDPLLTYIKEA